MHSNNNKNCEKIHLLSSELSLNFFVLEINYKEKNFKSDLTIE